MPITLESVAAFASSLPDVTVGLKWGNRTWVVGGRGFAWQRPFSKTDLRQDHRVGMAEVLGRS